MTVQPNFAMCTVVAKVKGCLLLWTDSGSVAGFQLSQRRLVASRIDSLTRLQEIQ
jgi:hypothetical protein